MPKFLRSRTYSTIVVILGIAGIIYSAYRFYYYTMNGDQFRMFMSGGLIIMFAVLTINNYLNLKRQNRTDNKTNIS